MSILRYGQKIKFADGGVLRDSGGPSGGGQPVQQSVNNTQIPDYARPYVENLLGQTAALTDINQNPYQPYEGQRVAGFTPMQTQAFQNIANQQVAGQIGEASNMASQVGNTAMGAWGQGQQLGQAGLGYGAQGSNLGVQGGGMYGGMGAGYGGAAAGMSGMGFGAGQRYAQQATSPEAMQSYMSPYMQNVVDWQKQQAVRDYGIGQQTQSAKAVASGAYGGSRQAVQQAEGQRALQNQLAGIQATGTQNAFQNAQQAQQFGANLGLQGLQAGYQGLGMGIQGAQTGLQGVNAQLAGTAQGLQGVGAATAAGQYGLAGLGQAGSAASTLGALGQTQFSQQSAINQAQANAGAQQQALQQQGLQNQYQDYLNQMNYPYQQASFMSNILRGVPLGQQSTAVYQAPPNSTSQLAGLGLTGASIYGLMKKKGGKIEEKAGSGLADLELHRLVGKNA